MKYRFTLTNSAALERRVSSIAVLEINGTEAISQSFRYQIELLLHGAPVLASQFLGARALLEVGKAGTAGCKQVYGDISEITIKARQQDRTQVTVILEPWLARLAKTINSRVFQDKSITSIIKTIMLEHGFASDLLVSFLPDDMPKIPFCLQYNESDLDFVQRLLQEYGIFYRLYLNPNPNPNQQLHQLCLHTDYSHIAASNITLLYKTVNRLVADQDIVYEKRCCYRTNVGGIKSSSYRFSPRSWEMRRPVYESDVSYRQFFHAGTDLPRLNLEYWSDARIGELHAHEQSVYMLTTSRVLSAGDLFVLTHAGHEIQQYVITAVTVQASQPSEARQHATNASSSYFCELQCLPVEVNYLPPGPFMKPSIHGVLTAQVVGPYSKARGDFHSQNSDPVWDSQYKHGDVYCDSVGRVLIQFSWQEFNHQTASFWVRVGSPNAGAGHGMQFVPRIGDVVLVSFIGGNPDAPIIIGSVFGESGQLPYELPLAKEHLVLRGHGKAGQANELFFDDKSGKRKILLRHASGHALHMDESGCQVGLESAGRHKLLLSDKQGQIQIKSRQGHVLSLCDGNDTQAALLHMESRGGHRLSFDDKKQQCQMRSAAGHVWILDDKEQYAEWKSPGRQSIQINDKENLLQIKTAKGLSIQLDDNHERIRLVDAENQLELILDSGKSLLRLSAISGDIELSAPDGELRLDANRVSIKSSHSTQLQSDQDVLINAGNQIETQSGNFNNETDGEYVIQAQLIKLN